MRDAGLEVVPEARDRRGQLALVGVHEVVAQQRGQRRRRGCSKNSGGYGQSFVAPSSFLTRQPPGAGWLT